MIIGFKNGPLDNPVVNLIISLQPSYRNERTMEATDYIISLINKCWNNIIESDDGSPLGTYVTPLPDAAGKGAHIVVTLLHERSEDAMAEIIQEFERSLASWLNASPYAKKGNRSH